MTQGVSELTHWLESQKGNNLMITKEEFQPGKHDIDTIQLSLNKVVLHHIQDPDPEDYVAKQEVVLHGEGKIHTDQGEMELPQHTFEIPIYDDLTTRNMDTEFQVKTHRAVYSFQIL
jgi:hypothetical protein